MRLPGSKIALSGKPKESGDFKRGKGEKERKIGRERGGERERLNY